MQEETEVARLPKGRPPLCRSAGEEKARILASRTEYHSQPVERHYMVLRFRWIGCLDCPGCARIACVGSRSRPQADAISPAHLANAPGSAAVQYSCDPSNAGTAICGWERAMAWCASTACASRRRKTWTGWRCRRCRCGSWPRMRVAHFGSPPATRGCSVSRTERWRGFRGATAYPPITSLAWFPDNMATCGPTPNAGLPTSPTERLPTEPRSRGSRLPGLTQP